MDILNIPNEQYIVIENKKNWILDKIECYNPIDPRYIPYWKQQKKICIEGLWRQEFGMYRHMPGNLYFYGNFGAIMDTDKKTKETKKIKPLVQDLEWELSYMYLEARGFSGWLEDDEYTSNNYWFEYSKEIPDNPNLSLFTKEGKLKKYRTPREEIRRLHEYPKGRPLFENDAQNICLFGSRGGGKSYFLALAVFLYQLCFDGATKYKLGDANTIELCIGSADTDKSGELLSKVIAGMNQFALDKELGVWGDQGSDNWTPMPFYKDMNGPTKAGNKDSGGWKHNYSKKVKGRWQDGFGTQSLVYHVSYSDKKKAGAEAAAGGRYNVSGIEEGGLSSNLIEIWNSNVATVKRSGVQFGVQWIQGTSGNVELIQPTKDMFNNPEEYNVVCFNDNWEGTGNIGFFLPAYLTYRQFKDVNGNTDLKAAKAFWLKGYEEASKSSNPKTLRMYCMNFPAIPSHMWASDKNYLLPYEESVERDKQLQVDNLYKKIGKAVELYWDSDSKHGVNYRLKVSSEPFYFFPIRKDRESLDGEIMIYEFPQYIQNVIPNDMYIFLHDPYVSDNIDEGESLGTTLVFLNPKYSPEGYNGLYMVASYIGKHIKGKKGYYQNLEKLLALYGNPLRNLWYESNRGDYCKEYFINKGKEFILCLRPKYSNSDSAVEKRITNYGITVGNKIAKVGMIDDTHDLLLSNITFNGNEKKMIETMPCTFLLKQMIMFNLDGNFDAVSALILLPTVLKEIERNLIQNTKEKQANRLTFLSMNPRQLNNIGDGTRVKNFKKRYYEDITNNR